MYGLRPKKLTCKKDAQSGGSNQTECSGIQSKRVPASNSKRMGATNTRKSKRSADDTVGSTKRSGTATIGSAERSSIAASGSTEKGSTAAARSAERGSTAAVGSTGRGGAIAADLNTERIVANARNTERMFATVDGSTERRVAAASNTERRDDDAEGIETRSANANENTKREGCAARNNERRISAVGVHSRIVASNSERTSIVRGDGDADVHSHLSGGVNSNLNIGSKWGCQAPAKRGRAKMARTELAMPPRSGRVELEPVGHKR